jgi:hypothetical protein
MVNMRIETDRQRRPANSPTLFTARDVPAGLYGVQVRPPQEGVGTLMVRVGATPMVLRTIRTELTSGPSSFAGLRLPTNIRSLTIDGGNTATRSGVAIELRPMGTIKGGSSDSAHRAAQYESGTAFFLDEHAYPEPTGFWVAGGRESTVILSTHAATRALFVRNAPIDNHVTIDVDGSVQQLMLGPGEERLVALPRAELSGLRVRITSQSGFRPSSEEPGSTDMRYLGCWIELR